MAKPFKYKMIAGPYSYWAVADAFARGYNQACKDKGQEVGGKVGYFLYRDIYHTGYVPKGMGDGFYVLRQITLTKEEKDEIDRKEALKAAEAAEKRAEAAAAEAARYRKLAAT